MDTQKYASPLKIKKVLIVDDSLFFRHAIRAILEAEPTIEIVGEAVDGEEAVRLANDLHPDLITMDVELPGLTGIEATTAIMKSAPCPIIMVSNYTQAQSGATIEALAKGAVDFISKKSEMADLELSRVNNELLEKVRFWAGRPLPVIIQGTGTQTTFKTERYVIPPPSPVATNSMSSPYDHPVDLVVVGVSTGGPLALNEFLAAAKVIDAPIVVAQHMPPLFTARLADHLARRTCLNVMEGRDGMALVRGEVIIAPGGANATIIKNDGGGLYLKIRSGPTTPFKPSVDLLYLSAAATATAPLAITLTGMGVDGRMGAREFHRRGFASLAQEPTECVIDGMPKAIINAGFATSVHPLRRLGQIAAKWSTHLVVDTAASKTKRASGE